MGWVGEGRGKAGTGWVVAVISGQVIFTSVVPFIPMYISSVNIIKL